MSRIAWHWKLSAVFLAVMVFALPAFAQRGNVPWQPGSYLGLVTGTSTVADVVRVLGKPNWQGPSMEVPPSSKEIQYHYGLASNSDACCDVFFKNGILQAINLNYGKMSQEQAEKQFGGGFTPMHFSAFDDGSNSGSSPLCEDPKGTIVLLLNPNKGMVLSIAPHGDEVTVVYSATRPGRSHCPIPKKK